jgi:phosphopantetheine adenylyltransferase
VASEKKQRFENLTKGYYLLVKRYTTVFERMTLAITQNENEEYETNNI